MAPDTTASRRDPSNAAAPTVVPAPTAAPERSPTLGPEMLGLPLAIWGALASMFCMIVGWNWDISWHRSIGRDTVWTLPHIAIYVALALAFVYNAVLVVHQTFFARDRAGIRVLGFHGPSAAFVTLWGVLLQFAAILFDSWWHNVYGLDVDVFSPPHGLLGWGIAAFYIGQFMMVALYRNGAPPDRERRTRWTAIVLWSLFVAHTTIVVDPSYGPMGMRSILFIATSVSMFPFSLSLIQGYVGWRWASAASAAAYMAGMIVLMQVFQLFPATPQFGPVFHRLGTFLPPMFPVLLVVPALAITWAIGRLKPGGGPAGWVLVGAAFVVSFNATNWLMSWFLTSPVAANRFFAGHYPGTVFEAQFRGARSVGLDLPSAIAVLIAVVGASFMSWVAVQGGRWMRGLAA